MTSDVKKKMGINGVIIFVLVSMLIVTTLALILSFVEIDKNNFETGTVKIGMDNSSVIFDDSSSLIEPNQSLVRHFTITNEGNADVYYRLYLDNIQGQLQSSLNFDVYEGNELLYTGSALGLKSKTSCVSHRVMLSGETREVTIIVYMNKDSGNIYQNELMSFDISVDAVQSKNNPQSEFD